MANLSETPNYDSGIYQIETTDQVLGGPTGIANAQAKSLANRTAFLKQQIDQLNSGTLTPSWIASQSYVQGELQKLDCKQSVRAATTENITLSGAQTIDGVVLAVGDRVLVKDQTNANQNGIYLVAAAAWTRPADADSGTKLTSGARVAVEEGAINAGRVWYLATIGSISVGSTALQFKDEHPDATESVKGVIEIATQEEVNETATANQKDDVAVSPKKLRSGFAALFASNGYVTFPTWMGGLIIQWGTTTYVNSVGGIITFPIAFPHALLGITNNITESTGNYCLGQAVNLSATGFLSAIYTAIPGSAPQPNSTITADFKWIAIGW